MEGKVSGRGVATHVKAHLKLPKESSRDLGLAPA